MSTGTDGRGAVITESVWIAASRRGIAYHELPEPTRTTCGRSTRTGYVLRRSQVIDEYRARPCPRCYP